MKKIIALLSLPILFLNSQLSAQPEAIQTIEKKESVHPTDLYLIDKNGGITLTVKGASFIAGWNLSNFQKEFPHNRVVIYNAIEDVQRPKESNPAFYDYADWHSAVHSRWTMVKLLKLYPKLPEAKQLREMIDKTIDTAKINGEIDFFLRSDNLNIAFEFPYGQSWLLKLAAELHSWNDPQAKKWYEKLYPLTKLIENVYFNITYQQPMADRYGHHENTAFGLLNGLDYAEEMKNDTLQGVIRYKAINFYGKDRNAPLLYEPCNQDFLAPNFLEAAIMSRVLGKGEFTNWLNEFMPSLFELFPEAAFKSQKSEYNSHLKGYNLTKAYCLNTILKNIDYTTEGYTSVKEASHKLVQETLPLLMKGDFDDSHWLGSFILLAITSDK